ncbi:hypothetical protein EB796_014281 [Bugula neritina]|uniref:Uncharacterized protein n=1 Tax=Bugula neritina TaxID=10212 RepID=A0A7J7JM96_BUGNE|nr:hypothetical protein EB796_014281 [Bugula neritina]
MAAADKDVPIDVITGRPRTPNTQYTCLTDEQLANIQKKSKSETLFAASIPKKFDDTKHYKNRYVDSYSQHLTREGSGYKTQRFCYVDDQWNRYPTQQYDTCRPLASEKWGTYKCGIRTAGYHYGQPTHMYTKIDMYRRNPTNTPGETIVKFGRPAEGYYTQKYPSDTTWNESRVPLNRTKVLQTVPAKSTQLYKQIEEYQKDQLGQIKEQWPHFSEYTDRYAMKTRILPVLDHDINVVMERRKKYLNAAVNEV